MIDRISFALLMIVILFFASCNLEDRQNIVVINNLEEYFKTKEANEHNQRGMKQIHLGKYKSAKSNFEKGLMVEPKNPVILCNLGNILVEEENYQEAESLYLSSLLHSDSLYAGAWINLGRLYSITERDHLALYHGREGLRFLEDNNPYALGQTFFHIAWAQANLGVCDSAVYYLNLGKSLLEPEEIAIEGNLLIDNTVKECIPNP